MLDYLGLILEVVFLAFGVYLYLFSIGWLKAGSLEVREKAEAFRKRNGWWMRIGALAIIAIMAVNIYLHVLQLAS